MKLPSRFGNFILELDSNGGPISLGSGAFGQTFLGKHEFLESPAAIKFVHRKDYSSSSRQKFLNEARTAASLDHPHIARVLDFGESEGQLYYAVAYCSGGSLEAIASERHGLSTQVVAGVAYQTAQALAHAHQAGFLHRDVKPANILQADTGEQLHIKLIDFGLAAAFDALDSHAFQGSPLFSSPEQLLGQSLDARSDLYSLGVTLWWILLGRAPVDGATKEVVAWHLAPESHADALPAGLPDWFRQILGKMLAKNPDERISSSQELLIALQQQGIGGPVVLDEKTHSMPVIDVDSLPSPEEESEDPTTLYNILHAVDARGPGTLYEVERKDNEERLCLWMSHDQLDSEEMLSLRTEIAVVKDNTYFAAPGRFFQSATQVGLELPLKDWSSLTMLIRQLGPLPLQQAAALLRNLAAAIDSVKTPGTPQALIVNHSIYCDEDSQIYLLPQLLSAADEHASPSAPEASATIDLSQGNKLVPTAAFANIVYFVLGGRVAPGAVSLSRSAYNPIPQLSEAANRSMAGFLAQERSTLTCVAALEEIFAAEGLRQTGTASATQTRIDLPNPATSTSTTNRPFPSEQAIKPRTESRPSPKPEPKSSTPPARQKSSTKPAWVGVVILLACLGLLIGGLVYFAEPLWQSFRSEPETPPESPELVEVQPSPEPTATPAATPEASPEPTPSVASADVLRVPQDVPTLTQALLEAGERKVMLDAGEYQENLELTQTAHITGAPGATVVVTPRNQDQPAITLNPGSRLTLENLTLRGGAAEALITVDNATLELHECQFQNAGRHALLLDNQAIVRSQNSSFVESQATAVIANDSDVSFESGRFAQNYLGLLTHASRVELNNVEFDANAEGAVSVHGATVSLAGNRFSSHASTAVLVGAGTELAAENNTFKDNQLALIALSESQGTMQGNTFEYQAGQAAFYIEDGSRVLESNNTKP
ncbi:MAG: protein kinase [Verrucomicrobiales bacterium]